MKEKYMFIAMIVIALLLSGCESEKNECVLEGYKSCDEYFSDGFRKYTDYCRYYYNESFDTVFAGNACYTKLTEDCISVVRNYFENFPYKYMDEPDKYDFDTSCITEGDYYYKKESDGAYDIGLYDTESHTLYYIHNN